MSGCGTFFKHIRLNSNSFNFPSSLFRLNTNPSQYYNVCFTLKWLKMKTLKRFLMLIIYHFELHPCIIQLINTLCVSAHPSVSSLNICMFTMELHQRQHESVGEECSRDVTVSHPMYD